MSGHHHGHGFGHGHDHGPGHHHDFFFQGFRAFWIEHQWEALDDQYVAIADAGGNNALFGDYSDPDFGAQALAVNTGFVELGLDYLDYLKHGGRALTDVFVKTDNGRMQSIHDNILGNLTHSALDSRDLFDDYGDQVPQDYLDRAYYSGNASAQGGAAHDAVRVFDYAHGFDRRDYIETDSDGALDASARDGNNMIAGTGIPADSFAVVRHEGAGVELGLDVIYRQGPGAEQHVGADGLVHFEVAEGTQSTDNGSSVDNAARAAWSFNYSIATGLNGADGDLSDFKFVLKFDTDISEHTNYRVFVGQYYDDGNGSDLVWIDQATGLPVIGDDDGNANVSQNSENIAFDFLHDYIDGDPQQHPHWPWWSHHNAGHHGHGHDPIDPYDYGQAQFDIELLAYDDHDLIATNHVVVDVNDALVV